MEKISIAAMAALLAISLILAGCQEKEEQKGIEETSSAEKAANARDFYGTPIAYPGDMQSGR